MVRAETCLIWVAFMFIVGFGLGLGTMAKVYDAWIIMKTEKHCKGANTLISKYDDCVAEFKEIYKTED